MSALAQAMLFRLDYFNSNFRVLIPKFFILELFMAVGLLLFRANYLLEDFTCLLECFQAGFHFILMVE